MNQPLLRLIELDSQGAKFKYECKVESSLSVRVLNSGIAIKGLRVLPMTLFENISKKRKRNLINYAYYKRFTEKRVLTNEKALIIHHIWSNGYHHWLCDCLPKLLQIDTSDFTLFLPENYPDFAFESLSYFPFKSIKKIPVNTSLVGNDITLISNPPTGHFDSEVLRKLKNRIVPKSMSNNTIESRRIFISRKNAPNRVITNELDLYPILADFGFEILDAGSLSFKDQVELFSNCEIILSNHGAGLTNGLFMPNGSTMIELYRKMRDDKDRMNLCYYRLAEALGLSYLCHFIDEDTTNDSVEADRRNVLVDPDLFRAFLSENIKKKTVDLPF